MDGPEPSQELKIVPAAEAPPGQLDSRAEQEELAIQEDRYAEDGKKRDHTRLQQFKTVLHWSVNVIVLTGVAIVAFMALAWAAHLLLPPRFRWLEPEEIDHLQALLFSGALSAAVTLMGRKVL